MANLCPCAVGLLVCSSPLAQKLSSEQERAAEGSEIIAAADVTQEAASKLREEIQAGMEDKAGGRQRWCVLFGSAPVNLCV